MKQIKRALCLVFALCIVVSQFSTSVFAANYFTTTPTGYKSASDVNYVKSSGYVANWGARGEVATFLSTYAQSFYTGSNTYASLSQKSGGTSQSNAPSSALYSALKSFMSSKHSYVTSYNATRNLYKYTDCIGGNYSKISSFYSGELFNSAWDGGSTWNREHTWPNSKGDASGDGENDIMMLRPTLKTENGSRGNKAYGIGTGYHDPNSLNANVRGDCARIILYQYVRWGCTNTGSKFNPTNIFGTQGVIQSLDVMLQWMIDDPVDTWELGRNDAVQSITGTRNVFVDYPEFAFLLFGEEIPKNMQTPSGIAANVGTGDGVIGGGDNNDGNNNNNNDNNDNSNVGDGGNDGQQGGQQGNTCAHERTEIRGTIPATCVKEGNTGKVVCETCGAILQEGKATAKLAHVSRDGDDRCDTCSAKVTCKHANVALTNKKDATCGDEGYTGDFTCQDCGAVTQVGSIIERSGNHVYGEWTVIKPAVDKQSGLKTNTCVECGESVAEIIPAPNGSDSGPSTLVIILIIVGGVLVLGGATVAMILIIKKKKRPEFDI